MNPHGPVPFFAAISSARLMVVLLVLVAAPTLAVANAPASNAGAQAHRWAGQTALASAMPARVNRAGGAGAFSDLTPRPLTPESSSALGESSDGTWSLLAGSGVDTEAPARVTHAGIFDPVRQRMVFFGGGSSDYENDTWVRDLAEPAPWKELATLQVPPSPRRLHSAIYDSENDRMVVFGGYDGGFYNDVWVLSFASDPPAWTEIATSSPAPPPRAGHAAIYDPVGRQMIVFAGYDGASPSLRRNDVWALSLHGTPAWTDISPAMEGPSARSSLDAVYDSARRRMVIFGGTDPAFLNDTWALSLAEPATWAAIEVEGPGPPAREEHSAVYDVTHDRMVIFGGYDAAYYYGDTWALTFSDPPAWNELDPTGLGPGPRWGHVAVFDPVRTRMVVFGGSTDACRPSGTYSLELAGAPTWSNAAESPGPGPVRHTFASAYDPGRQRLVLFGGSSVASYLNDTWVITLDDHPLWSPLVTHGTPPSPRRLVEGIYDPRGDRMIVFGGFDGGFYRDLWQLSFETDPPAWSPLVAGGDPPPARAGHGAIYDPRGRRMLVFGGYDGVSSPHYRLNDVWSLSLGPQPEWEQLTPSGVAPSPRSSPTVVYDGERRRMLVFGGTTPAFTNEVWALSLQGQVEWRQILPNGTPPVAREEHSAIYDPVRRRLVVFGGYVDPYFTAYQDAWELTLEKDEAPPTWRQLFPAEPQPIDRWGHAAVYDPVRDRMIMHGGLGLGLDQTWALTWGHPESVDPILESSEATSERVRLTCNITAGAYLSATLYRSEDGAAWLTAGHASVSPAGEAVFEDDEVAPGLRYAYRASVTSGSGERFSDPVWVDVPGLAGIDGQPARLAVLDFRSTPGAWTAWISLASDAPARLRLFDIGGREVSTLDLDASTPGRHEVLLPARGEVSPGVYILRLAQAGKAATLKAALLK